MNLNSNVETLGSVVTNRKPMGCCWLLKSEANMVIDVFENQPLRSVACVPTFDMQGWHTSITTVNSASDGVQCTTKPTHAIMHQTIPKLKKVNGRCYDGMDFHIVVCYLNKWRDHPLFTSSSLSWTARARSGQAIKGAYSIGRTIACTCFDWGWEQNPQHSNKEHRSLLLHAQSKSWRTHVVVQSVVGGYTRSSVRVKSDNARNFQHTKHWPSYPRGKTMELKSYEQIRTDFTLLCGHRL